MTLSLPEALDALLLFVLIVRWTMFARRRHGEPPDASPPAADGQAERTPPADDSGR